MDTSLVRLGCFVIKLLLIGTILTPLATAVAQVDEHGTGYYPDEPEVPGTVTHMPRFRAFLPAFKDLSGSFPPPGDQGHQASCVAWSVGYALRGYYFRKRMQSHP